jgi:hypothetical protein
VESLNAAIAGSVLLYDAMRQRQAMAQMPAAPAKQQETVGLLHT